MMERKIKALLNHGIDFDVRADRLIAYSVSVGRNRDVESTPVDVTEYTLKQLAEWMGY